ncbi:NAD(P)-binding domain-containing protein [Paenibacillus sp. EPM92]|uniref:NAD(P)-binding domain-containing protein n=1 Tax=Paenibacillus sp. EPM92 TaxID=1561195 RepID=UPI001F3B6698|nr:NAD(P)-binding domain-containing protein [Paenibacillus sp. EPM92]
MSECCSSSAQLVPIMQTGCGCGVTQLLPLDDNRRLPVAIIGGGPVGLAAAAHLVSKGESFVLFEAASEVAGNIQSWSHVRLFSPWKYNIDKAAKELLEVHGWKAPSDDEHPTGGELVEKYLDPLSKLSSIKPNIHYNAKVVAISRKGLSKVKTYGREKLPFVLRVKKDDKQIAFEAKAVIDASGTWSNPNPSNSEGVWTEEERLVNSQIFYGIPDVLDKDRVRYSRKKVLVVGSGHSAVNALLDLERLQHEEPETNIIWVIRKSNVKEVYGGQENDGLRERGVLGVRLQKLVEAGKLRVYTSFNIVSFNKDADKIIVTGRSNDQTIRIEGIDEIITSTGSRPDINFLREVRIDLDPALESVDALAQLIDPNIHSCGTVRPHGERELRQPEQNFYIVGSKSYGRAPTFLLATGYEQVRSVVAALTGDFEEAEKVELELPETGVCSISSSSSSVAAESCCGGSVPVDVDACCAADANAKTSGNYGCGCGTALAETAKSISKNSSCCG